MQFTICNVQSTMTLSSNRKVDRPDIFWELTRSICPECKRVIDAQIRLRDGKVFMRKRCPDHGWFEALVFGDALLYTEIARYNKPGTLPLEFATEVKDGCPHDCGLCPEHQQHACLGIIEVNAACNLDCPLCFAGSGTHLAQSGFELSYAQVEYMLDRFVAAEGNPEVIQFSGGEPTLHPRIIEFVELAQAKGITYVMINTNGIKIARDDKLLAELARVKPQIYLQFDGFEQQTNAALRGRPDLLKDKLRALDRLAEVDVRVVLVAAIERGVNEHEIGRIVEFGMQHPAVFGINFQPAFRAQRHLLADPLTRITIPDVLCGIEEQTGGLLRTLERLWSSSAMVGSDRAAADVARALSGPSTTLRTGLPASPPRSRTTDRCSACQSHLPLTNHTPRDLARHVFMINTRDFMDPWTFNVKNVMKCCVEFLIPDGRMIPFCAYNSVGYREQVSAELNLERQNGGTSGGAMKKSSL